jgi:hypothetical protein
MGVKTKWPKVQDIVAWGLEQNDLRLPRVPRCHNFIIIPYMEPKVKNFRLSKGQNLKDYFAIGLGNLWFIFC